MRIVTWNILHPDHINVYPDVERKYLEYEHRLPLIIERIRKYDADVVCLQEADAYSIVENFAEFKEYTLVYQNDKSRTKRLDKYKADLCKGDLSSKKPNTLVCAMLVRNDFAKVTDTKVGSRSLTVDILTAPGKTIKITNVHLESGKGTTEIHIKHLSKLLDSDIICGDFNDFPGEPAMEFLDEKGLTSVYKLRCPKQTFVHINKKWIIDFIYHRGLKLKHVEWLEITGVTEKHPSDHSPVIADYEI